MNHLSSPGSYIIGCNYWASHAGTAMWSDWHVDVVEADLRQLSEAGLQVLRVFPLWPDFQPITRLRGGGGAPREIRLGEQPLPDDEIGRAGLSPLMLERFQVFADLAEKYHLQLLVGLLTGWMSGRLFVPPALEGLNVLTDPLALMWETRFVRAFVRRFKSHPAIRAWDLGNECNVMAPVPSREAAYAWVSAITNAIRVEDPTREVVSGMHGDTGLWQPEMLGEIDDLVTTHPYPLWTQYCDQDPVDTIRTILHSTAESVLYAGRSGKPCLVEETGVMGPMLAGDETAARFLRSILFSTWAHDTRGLLWWCAYDQEHLAHAPYDWNTVERELGLIRKDRAPKPVLAELGRFRDVIEGLPFQPLPPPRVEAVCLLSQDTDNWALAYSSFILAKQAGFDMQMQMGEAPLPAADLYLVPSIRGINVMSRHRWLALLEKIRDGATLYLSLDDGLLAEFEQTFGLRVQTRSRRSDGQITFSLPGAGDFHTPAPFRLEMVPAGAEVLAKEPDGNPVFTRYAYGKGEIYLLTAPIERTLAETPGAFHAPDAQPFWKIYATFASKQLAERAVCKSHPMLGLTEHPLNERERGIVAINYSPVPIKTEIILAERWQVEQIWYGGMKGREIDIPANDAVIFTMERRRV
jgi:hypothetical protein